MLGEGVVGLVRLQAKTVPGAMADQVAIAGVDQHPFCCNIYGFGCNARLGSGAARGRYAKCNPVLSSGRGAHRPRDTLCSRFAPPWIALPAGQGTRWRAQSLRGMT